MSGRGMPAQCRCVEAQAGGSQRGEYFLTGVVSFTEEMAFELSLRMCRVCRDVEGLSRQESRSAQTEVRDVVNQLTHLSGALRGQGEAERGARLGPGHRGPRITQAKWRVDRCLGSMPVEFCLWADVIRAVL